MLNVSWCVFRISLNNEIINSLANEDGERSVCPKIVKRLKWGANPPKMIDYQVAPIKSVIIHHTVTPRCSNKLKCSEILTSIQRYHMDEANFDDIGFQFGVFASIFRSIELIYVSVCAAF